MGFGKHRKSAFLVVRSPRRGKRHSKSCNFKIYILTEEALHRVQEERNILHTVKRRKANWIGHILRRNCLLKHVFEGKIEGRIEVTGRRGRRLKQLLNDLKET
jgi:hypothetical protein